MADHSDSYPLLRRWLAGEQVTGLAADAMEVEVAAILREVADLRTMVDFPEVVAGYAGPSGSTCMKVIGNDEKEHLRRSWKNAITQWQWWHERYAAATGDTRGRTQIEMAEIAERRKENRHA